MSSIDVDSLLAGLSEDKPCGEDLEYDPAYTELMTLAQGKAEQVMGDQVIPAEEPNWREVRDRCLELLKRTKDLRVTMYLTVSTLKLEGLPGLRDGFKLLHGVLAQYWDQLYPLLDPEDNNDPTERVNIIDSLARPPHTSGDAMRFQELVRETPLCHSKQMGQFSMRDIAIANGDSKPISESEPPPTTAAIDAAFMDTDLEPLQIDVGAVAESIELVKSIEDSLTERLGAGNAPNLSSFVKVLQEIHKNVAEYLGRRGVGVDGAGEGDEAGEDGEAAAGGQGDPIKGNVRTREDVIRILDKAIDYYQRHEPSSPVPLLLGRAKRLVTKNFVDIIQDLTPDAMTQIMTISGLDSEGE